MMDLTALKLRIPVHEGHPRPQQQTGYPGLTCKDEIDTWLLVRIYQELSQNSKKKTGSDRKTDKGGAEVCMANKNDKRCSNSLVQREMVF